MLLVFAITDLEDMMATDRDNPDAKHDDVSEKDSSHEGKRVIGKGMTSPDSTQVPLRADTGEPDWDAIKGRVPKDLEEDEDSSKR
jgi:hypothetical protein